MNRNTNYIHPVNRTQFVRSCFDDAIVDRRLHGKWWNLDHVAKFMNKKYALSDETNIKQAELLRCLSKSCTDTTSTGNRLLFDRKPVLLLFRHAFRLDKGARRHFIYLTVEENCKPPKFSFVQAASKWEEEFASSLLPRVTRRVVLEASTEPPTK